jgi:CTP synthase
VSLVPVVGAVGEPKSKPTQHGVKELRAAGLSPDIIVCRSTAPLPLSVLNKISLFCMVPATHLMCIHDVSNIYRVPLLMLQQRLPETILGCLKINKMPPTDLPKWRQLAETVDSEFPEVRIALVGKYTGLSDSYLSVTKALQHAAIAVRVSLKIEWIESAHLEKEDGPENQAWATLRKVHGILVPGGFGDRGVQGKVLAVKYARESKIPFFGICLGMQMAVIEFARNILDLENANSAEFDDKTQHPVVMFMPEISQTHMGGTMRLGSRATNIAEGSLAHKLYVQKVIHERHRHRYEVNPKYVEGFIKAGLVFSGKDDQKTRMEITELPDHPFFIGVQYHPEFLSRPTRPSPIFLGFVKAAAVLVTGESDSYDTKHVTETKTNGQEKSNLGKRKSRSGESVEHVNGDLQNGNVKDKSKGKKSKGKRKGGKKVEGKQEKKRKN